MMLLSNNKSFQPKEKSMQKLSRRSLVKSSLSAMLATGVVSAAHAQNANQGTSDNEQVFDVVIIGSGCAAWPAAIEAKKAGASPVILEKMEPPFR